MTVDERKENILERLPDFYEKEVGSVNYGLALSFAEEFNDYDNEVQNLHLEVFVNTATGERLDDLGRIYKLSRKPGETDDQFRARIIAYWPGFSGGGTIDAIKTTVAKITGIPATSVVIVEDIPPALTFNAEISLLTPADLTLVETIRDVVWDIKAAGIYPFFTWVLTGTLTDDFLEISDSVSISIVIPPTGYFVIEVSLLDDADTIS